VSASTGPILAAVAVTVANNVVLHNQPWSAQARPVVGGAVVAAFLSMTERALPGASVGFAWLILAGVLLVRQDPNVPAPLETFAAWWDGYSIAAPNPSKKPSK
jgi:ABC-type Fe3+ transport system permease subunit